VVTAASVELDSPIGSVPVIRVRTSTIAMRTLKLVSFAAALASALPAQWAQLTPTNPPSARRAGAAAFDATQNRMLLVGGIQPSPSTILGQTWSWNGTLWTQLSPAGGTIPRWGHGMVRNTQNNRLIVFGGRSPTLSAFANDTQEWTGTAWQTISTPVAPSARHLYGFAFDSVRNRAVLFGGRTSTQTLADTWEYDGVTWTQRTPATTPPARQEMAMVFDASIGKVVMFGGFDQGTNAAFGDTWCYDGSDWVEMTPAASPTPRYRMAAAYDSVRQRTVLYGGFNGTAILRDTYEFIGSTWNTVSTGATTPTASTESFHGYDPQRRKMVLFGGFGGTFSGELWEYTGANTGYFSTYGLGCPTALGEPNLTSNTPRINQPWTVMVDNVPSDCEIVLFAFGLSNSTWSGGSLPFDLGPLGLGGCSLNVAPDLVNVQLAAGGMAMNTFAFPNTTTLVNQRLFTQGVLFDILPSGDWALLASTKGGRALIGQ
jgi:hypothetical protein